MNWRDRFKRNAEIVKRFQMGETIEQLSIHYELALLTIKDIVRGTLDPQTQANKRLNARSSSERGLKATRIKNKGYLQVFPPGHSKHPFSWIKLNHEEVQE